MQAGGAPPPRSSLGSDCSARGKAAGRGRGAGHGAVGRGRGAGHRAVGRGRGVGHGAVGRGHGVGPGTGHGARGFGTAHAGPRAPALTGDGPSPLAVRREAPPLRGPCVEASPALLRRCSFRHVHPEIFRFSPKKAKCLFFLCFSRGKTVGGGTRKRNCARVERPGEGRDPREPPCPRAPPHAVCRESAARGTT